MSRDVYRYSFDDKAGIADVRDSLFLAVFSAEGVHGRAQVRLEAAFSLDEKNRTCVIDGSTPAGRTVARVFTELLTREFGEDAFRVERVVDPPGRASTDEPVLREGAAR